MREEDSSAAGPQGLEDHRLLDASPLGGRLSQLLVKKGDYVKVDQVICLIEGSDGQRNGGPAKSTSRPPMPAVEPEAKAIPSASGRDEPILHQGYHINRLRVLDSVVSRHRDKLPVWSHRATEWNQLAMSC